MVIYIMQFAALAMTVLQTVLCLKDIRRIWKFLPLIFCTAATAVLFLLSFVTTGWTSVGYWMIGCFSILSIAGCGIGWVLAWIIERYRK